MKPQTTIGQLTQHDGVWWPTVDVDGRRAITRDCARDVTAMLEHVPGRTSIVQAGGNVGVYPLALADHFRQVATFEPDPLNFECLVRNLQARDSLKRVTALCAGLGERRGTCDMRVIEAHNTGAHRVEYGEGAIPVWRIDDLPLKACDAIWLDVEGAEMSALKGAVATIAKFSPTICVEDKDLGRPYGVRPGDVPRWIEAIGYEQVAAFGRDLVFRRAP